MLNPQPDVITTALNTPVTFSPLANDGTGLGIVSYDSPTSGSLALNPDSSFVYTPNNGFLGTDSFSYTVRDSVGQTAQALVTILVASANQLPLAAPDMVETAPGQIVEIPILANDNDPDGGALTLIALGMPAHGTVSVTPAQTVRYAPDPGFTGHDGFDYTVADSRGGKATGTVTIQVAPANRAPLPQPDQITTARGQAVEIALFANDNDPDGDPLTLTGLNLPGHGSLVAGTNGVVTYTPGADFEGIDSFDYTVADKRGGSASSTVTVTVVAPNASPVAVLDAVTTESGRPVEIDLIANDHDPDSEPFTVSSLSLPQSGILTIGQNGRVTYTPNAGFIGLDSFDYAIRDARGAVANGNVQVTVSVPATPTAYANGYHYRRQIQIPQASILGSEALTGYPLRLAESGDWLKNVANGGRVQHASGFDLRFELADGTRLDHDIELYDATGGKLWAWVRLPELKPGNPLALFLYYGRAGTIVTEANPAAVWRDYLAVWHLPEVTDRTGRGRNLAATAITSAEGPIGAAARFNGTASELSLADATFLDGHAALTAQLWLKADQLDTGKGLMVSGPLTTNDRDTNLVLRHNQAGIYGAKPRVLTLEMAFADGRVIQESSESSASTASQALSLVFAAGTGVKLYLDGAPDTPSYYSGQNSQGQAMQGPTRLANGILRIGTGSKDSSSGKWLGLIDEVRFRASALSASWIAMEQANQRAPKAFYGLGAEDGFGDPTAGPVAVPVSGITSIGRAITLDPLARANDVDSAATLTLSAAGTPASGVAVISDGKLRYTPNATFTGTDSFTFTISDGSKSSTGIATVAVNRAAVPDDPDDDKPFRNHLYGNPYMADSIATVTFTGDRPLAKRLVAERTGRITAIAWNNRHQGAGGVSTGDGGDVLLRIESDANGLPSGTILGESLVNGGQGKPTSQGGFVQWPLTAAVPVTAGQPYHIVWLQTGSSGTTSVGMHAANVPMPDGAGYRGGPYEGDGCPVLQRAAGNGTWTRANQHGGFIQLSYDDGHTTGNTIVHGATDLRKLVGGAIQARQRFKVDDYSRIVDGLWFRTFWTSGTPGELQLRLEYADGTLIEQLAVPRAQIAQTGNVANDASSTAAPWLYRSFSRPYTLELGRSYAVRMSTASGSYAVQTVQRGGTTTQFATSRNQWIDAWAEASSDTGLSWRGWNDRIDYHMPVAFSVIEQQGTTTIDIAADVWLDTVAGSDTNSGLSAAAAKKTWSAAAALMSGGKKLGIKRGSSFNQKIQITNASLWQNTTIGAYGVGANPVFRYSQYLTPTRHTGNVWKVAKGTLPASTGYASGTLTRSTGIVVDGARWVYMQVSSLAEVTEPMKFFHDTGNGQLYFYDTGTPASIELPLETPLYVAAMTNLTIQDIEVASSRDHGLLVAGASGLKLLRSKIRRCGLAGVYYIGTAGVTLAGPAIEDCLVEETHANAISLTAANAGNTANRLSGISIKRNTVRYASMGTPWVTSGVTSDDYYAAGIKLFSGIHDKTAWGWTGEISDNLVEYIGNLDRDINGDHGQGIWLDTVHGKIEVLRNTIRQCKAAGVFVEMSPGQDHVIAYNQITDTGQRHTGWTGGVCLGRGSSNVLVHHNTIWGARRACILMQGLSGTNTSPGVGAVAQSVASCTIRDNILIPYAGAAVVRENPVGGARSTFTRNIVGTSARFEYHATAPYTYTSYGSASAWDSARGAGTASLSVDPLLVSAPLNLALQTGSPAQSAGTSGNIGAL